MRWLKMNKDPWVLSEEKEAEPDNKCKSNGKIWKLHVAIFNRIIYSDKDW